MRKVVAAALVLAMQAAALGAPLAHAHFGKHPTAHHGGRVVHTHWGGHTHAPPSDGLPVIGAADDDSARFLNAFVAVGASHPYPPGAPHASFALAVPLERAAHRSVAVSHGHDPPRAARRPSRAPPARLS